MITQEGGQENLQVEVKETGGSQHPVACDPNPCCGTRFSEALS